MVAESHRAVPSASRFQISTSDGHAALKWHRKAVSRRCENRMLYWLMVRVVADRQLQKWAAYLEKLRWSVYREYPNSASVTNQARSPAAQSFFVYIQFVVHSI